MPSGSGDTIAAFIAFPSLDAGDQVWVTWKAIILLANGATLTFSLRQDGVTGPVSDVTATTVQGSSVSFLQAVFTIPTPVTNKVFYVTMSVGDPVNASIDWGRTVALRRRR